MIKLSSRLGWEERWGSGSDFHPVALAMNGISSGLESAVYGCEFRRCQIFVSCGPWPIPFPFLGLN